MVLVYAETLKRRHYAPLIGDATLFRVFLFLVAVVVSLVVAFATGGFWVKLSPTLDQATVHYTYDALLLFEGEKAGQERMWTTSASLNSEFASSYIPANVQVGEEDFNDDNVPDMITFVANVQADMPIHGVKALLQFTYSFDSNVQLQMYTFAYMAYSSATPGGVLYTDGQLVLQQSSPITDKKYNGIYNTPMITSSGSSVQASQGVSGLDFNTILQGYLSRNYTTVYTNNFPVWKPSAGTGFELNMRIRIPPNQLVWYRPQVIEMLKFGWIQFLATVVPLYWFLSLLEYLMFRFRVVSTRVVSDFQPQKHKF